MFKFNISWKLIGLFTTGEEIVHHAFRSPAASLLINQVRTVPFYISWGSIFKSTEGVKIP